MKKIISLLFTVVLMLMLGGCSNKTTESSLSSLSTEESSTTVTVTNEATTESTENYKELYINKAITDNMDLILTCESADLGFESYYLTSEKEIDKYVIEDGTVVSIRYNVISALQEGKSKVTVYYADETTESFMTYVLNETTKEEVNSYSSLALNTYGRNKVVDSDYTFEWGASGVEVTFIGTTLSFNAKSSIADNRLRILVDGVSGDFIALTTDYKTYTVSDLENAPHTVRILKASDTRDGIVSLNTIETSGFFLTAKKKSDLRIEFIGDSITNGYGTLGVTPAERTLANSDATASYAYLTASYLKADYSVVAAAGICVKVNLYHPYSMETLYYDRTMTDSTDYDYSFNPNVIVLALGTNDQTYINSHSDYKEQFPVDYKQFVTELMALYPDAYIICMHGMMTSGTTRAQVKAVVNEIDNDHVLFLAQKINNGGASKHPDAASQVTASEKLIALIEGLNL